MLDFCFMRHFPPHLFYCLWVIPVSIPAPSHECTCLEVVVLTLGGNN